MATPDEEPFPASSSADTSPPGGSTLTDAQRAKVERNRQAALLRRQNMQQARPHPTTTPTKKPKPSNPIDTGGGFLIDPEEEEAHAKARKVVHPPGALLLLAEDELICDECGREFLESNLYETFRLSVCDECRRAEMLQEANLLAMKTSAIMAIMKKSRDTEEKHKLITRSTAKDKYLLKDVDLDKRDPTLRFVEKKNPHNDHWGRMKLYLESQVAARSVEVWGGEEQLEDERERRQDVRDKVKQKRYDKKVKDLRMAVRSSLWKKDVSGHEHEYGAETYDEDEDTYSKTCTSCGHILSYEKM